MSCMYIWITVILTPTFSFLPPIHVSNPSSLIPCPHPYLFVLLCDLPHLTRALYMIMDLELSLVVHSPSLGEHLKILTAPSPESFSFRWAPRDPSSLTVDKVCSCPWAVQTTVKSMVLTAVSWQEGFHSHPPCFPLSQSVSLGGSDINELSSFFFSAPWVAKSFCIHHHLL